MKAYLEMLQYILDHGRERPDRTGIGTLGVFGYQFRHSLSEGFPLLTTKRMFTKGIVAELLWLLSGETNIKPLVAQGVSIWTDWPLKHYNQTYAMLREVPPIAKQQTATKAEFEHAILHEPGFAEQWGDLGPVYGAQWRSWKGAVKSISYGSEVTVERHYIDQISELLKSLMLDPFSRRHVISAWNVADLEAMNKAGLSPCHCLFQFNVRVMTLRERIHYQDTVTPRYCVPWGDEPFERGLSAAALQAYIEEEAPERHEWFDSQGTPRYYLDCHLYQRSADVFLGVPFNIASYSLLTHLIAASAGMAAGDFIHSFGDLHIYRNHVEQVREQLSRAPLPLPRLKLTTRAHETLFDVKPEDIEFVDYVSHPAISAPIAV